MDDEYLAYRLVSDAMMELAVKDMGFLKMDKTLVTKARYLLRGTRAVGRLR